MGMLRRYDLAEMSASDPPKVPWVVRPLAAVGEVTVLYGVGGVAKSMFCLGLANGVAQGPARIAGLPCASAKAAYLDAENGKWETHRRVRAFGVDSERLAIYDATEVHLVNDYDQIERAMRKFKPRLVVLDSLRRMLPGVEENDSGQMADALGCCKRLAQRCRTAVVVIHHSKKDGETYRGSSAIHDQASIVYRLHRVEGDLDRLRRTLTNQKMRIAAEPAPRYLRVGMEGGAVVLADATEPSANEVAPGTASADLVPQILALLKEKPRARGAVAKALDRHAGDNTVRRVFDQLESAGRIERGQGNVWGVVAVAKPRGTGDGKSAAESVATGKRAARADGKGGVAKRRRGRQEQGGKGARR